MSRVLLSGVAALEARRFRDGGHEIVVLDGGASPEEVAAVAVQEDVSTVVVADTELGAAVAESLGAGVVVFWITSAAGPSSPQSARD